MSQEGGVAEADPGPSPEIDPASDPEGPSPEGTDAGEGGGEPEPEPEPEPGGEQSAAGPDEEDPDYKRFVEKFQHIKNPRDRNAAIGKAWWEKVRYDSQVRKENEELKLRLARLEGAQPKKDEPPPPPPPDLDRAVKKIEVLYQRGQALQARNQEIIKELNASDREVAIAEDRLKDLDATDERRPLALARVRQAKLEYEAARDRFTNIMDAQTALDERLETAIAEKDWIERFHKDQALRRQNEQKVGERFNAEFPRQVEGLVAAAANHVQLKLDEKMHASLWRHVNRALQADIRGQYLETDIEDIPVPQMVLSYVQEWAEDRDLAKRQTFAQTSKEKLAVASRSIRPPERKAGGPASAPPPAASRPRFPVALLSGDSTPSMAKARRLLVQRLGGTT